MFDDLYRQERAASLSQMVQRPAERAPEPGTFTGLGSALADAIPHAALTAGSAWTALLDAFGKASAYANAPTVAMMHGEVAPDRQALQEATIGQMGNSDDARAFRESAKGYAPDTAAVGVAGQIAHGLVSSLAKAAAYTAAAGPAAPVVFGADMGINRSQELSDHGVDGGTAAVAGLVTGITSAAGLKLPPALGATRLQSMAIGAGINPAMGIVERGAIHALLEHADYPAIAAQYKPLDPTQLAIEALSGAAFGGLFHSAKVKEGATLAPDEHAALLTMNEVRTRDADTLTRPGDIVAAGAAHDAQNLARMQMDAGQQVSVAHNLGEAIDSARLDEVGTALRDHTVNTARGVTDDMIMTGDRLVDFVQKAREDARDNSSIEVIGTVTAEKRAEILERTGIDVGQSREQIRSDIVRHSEKGHIDLTNDDWRMLPWLMQNFDEVHLLKTGANDKGPRMAFVARDPVTGIAYVAEALSGKQKGERLSVVTFFKDHPNSIGSWLETNGAKKGAVGLSAEPMPPKGSPVLTSETSAGKPNIAQRGAEAMPEIAAASERLAANPDMVVRLDDGVEVRADEALRAADAEIAKATTEAKGFQAAIACALRFGE